MDQEFGQGTERMAHVCPRMFVAAGQIRQRAASQKPRRGARHHSLSLLGLSRRSLELPHSMATSRGVPRDADRNCRGVLPISP